MILLLGPTSFIGQGFARALRRRRDSFIPLSRVAFDYTRFEFLFDYVRKIKPDLLINASEHGAASGAWNGAPADATPNASDGELDRMEMLQVNTILPQTIAKVCEATNTPWGHVSSGSIYSGARLLRNGKFHVERDLTQPAVRKFIAESPEKVLGFSETEPPNFTFQFSPCNFYSGTKALAEDALRHQARCFVWRFRLPFNELDHPGNCLSQVQARTGLVEAANSLSHVDDCVGACLDLWDRQAPFGTYNVVNPGVLTTTQLVESIQARLKTPTDLSARITSDDRSGLDPNAPCSHCVLDSSKLFNAGVRLRPVGEALIKSLEKWRPASDGKDRRQGTGDRSQGTVVRGQESGVSSP